MNVETVSAVFAGLAVMALAGSFSLAIGSAARGWPTHWSQPISALIAVTATLGSLYYSEVVGYEPCRFCWYQRIAMYPLALMLTVELISGREIPRIQPILLATIGASLSAYHYRLQLIGGSSTSCEIDNPCSAKWVEVADFITIPAMAFCGFVSIVILNSLAARTQL